MKYTLHALNSFFACSSSLANIANSLASISPFSLLYYFRIGSIEVEMFANGVMKISLEDILPENGVMSVL